jgi:ABC-type dipeptide/oligopeptide/nickel transport system permease component
MVRYLIDRLMGILDVLPFISLLTFCLMHLIPGGLFDEQKVPVTEIQKQNILQSFGLDKPLWQQYLIYLWNAVHLNFGVSYQSPGDTVIQLIGRVDFLIMRVVDALWSFPRILCALLILITLGSGLQNVLLAISLSSWIPVCRLARAQVLSERERDYVQAARAIG